MNIYQGAMSNKYLMELAFIFLYYHNIVLRSTIHLSLHKIATITLLTSFNTSKLVSGSPLIIKDHPGYGHSQ